jgi:hypothetical protein
MSVVDFVYCCCEQEQGIAVLTNATKVCAEAIEKHKGKLVVKEAARAVSSSLAGFNK